MRSAAKHPARLPAMRNLIATADPLDYFHVRFNHIEREALRELAAQHDFKSRQLCLEWLDNGATVRSNVNFALELLEALALDPRKDVRWEAFGDLRGYAEHYPHKLWPIVERLGASRSADIRSAVAVCILEHLLQYHCSVYLPRVREKIESGDMKMADILRQCYLFDEAEQFEDEIRALVAAGAELPHHA